MRQSFFWIWRHLNQISCTSWLCKSTHSQVGAIHHKVSFSTNYKWTNQTYSCGMYTIVIYVHSLPVSLHHWCLLYNCKKMANSWQSDSPLPRYKFICARKADSSSYNANNRPEFSLINAPIFSKEVSSNIQDGSSSVTLDLWQVFHIILNNDEKGLIFHCLLACI